MPTVTIGKTERRSTLGAFGFMLIGLAVGAVAGMLTAPKSGKQLRQDVGRKLDDARDAMGSLGEKAGDILERGGDLAEAAAKRAEPVTRFFRRGA